jgi:hypothetical protein
MITGSGPQERQARFTEARRLRQPVSQGGGEGSVLSFVDFGRTI